MDYYNGYILSRVEKPPNKPAILIYKEKELIKEIPIESRTIKSVQNAVLTARNYIDMLVEPKKALKH